MQVYENSKIKEPKQKSEDPDYIYFPRKWKNIRISVL